MTSVLSSAATSDAKVGERLTARLISAVICGVAPRTCGPMWRLVGSIVWPLLLAAQKTSSKPRQSTRHVACSIGTSRRKALTHQVFQAARLHTCDLAR